jgi:hypothetical protein
VAVSAAAVIVGLDFSPAASAAASTVTNGWASEWIVVPQSAGVPVASGVLTSAGKPSVGATVVLFAEPKSVAVADGSSVTDVPISRSSTDSTGNWHLSVPAGINLTRYADANGVINFEVQTFDSKGSDLYFLPAHIVSASMKPTVAAGDALIASHATVNGKAVSLSVAKSDASGIALDSRRIPNTRATQAQLTPQAVATPQIGICTTKGLTTTQNVRTWVGYTSNHGGSTFTSSIGEARPRPSGSACLRQASTAPSASPGR